MYCTWSHKRKTVDIVRKKMEEDGEPLSWPLKKEDFK